ncbi:hypothetical protein B277_00575 [Janibacter hoylei PVAS-1]|uniref:Uncharacterized protein n=1 Tax=Janibacter hoylei PVAS-1 TaxID=1210046 RepID=K1E1V9_9MICO|nr:hypothetical protein B277_00575 [Janibacter hoylei PVAS-1]
MGRAPRAGELLEVGALPLRTEHLEQHGATTADLAQALALTPQSHGDVVELFDVCTVADVPGHRPASRKFLPSD